MLDPQPFPLQAHLGMSVESRSPGIGAASLDVTPETHNPNGVVHGAVIFALVDTAMGAATMSVLQPGLACASIEVHVRFMRPTAAGTLTATAEVIKSGRRIVHLDGRVHDVTGRLVAAASGTFAVIEPEL